MVVEEKYNKDLQQTQELLCVVILQLMVVISLQKVIVMVLHLEVLVEQLLMDVLFE